MKKTDVKQKSNISLNEKLSNYLLEAILQAMLAVCMGIKMRLTPSLGYDNIV